CVAHPTLARWDSPPGAAAGNGSLTFNGLVLSGTARATRLLVPLCLENTRVGIARLDLGSVDAHPICGLDETLEMVAVAGRIDGAAASTVARCDWDAVTLAARRALAHETCALAQSMLDEAVAYVTARHQFGRPIAAFQTVRHRLTEVLVAIASARAAIDAAWS